MNRVLGLTFVYIDVWYSISTQFQVKLLIMVVCICQPSNRLDYLYSISMLPPRKVGAVTMAVFRFRSRKFLILLAFSVVVIFTLHQHFGEWSDSVHTKNTFSGNSIFRSLFQVGKCREYLPQVNVCVGTGGSFEFCTLVCHPEVTGSI